MTAISKKATAFLLAVIMLMSLLPLSVMAAEATTLTFKVESVTAITGSSAQVRIDLKHNPGVSSIKLKVSYDSSLALTSVQYNSEMGGQTLAPGSMTSPATLIWLNPFDNFSGDVTFATLTFKTPSNITESYTANVNVSYDEDDIYNMQENNVPCEAVNGGITVFAGVPGDINGDGTCNNKDLTRFFQYLANWNVTVNEMATDTNGDGSVNMKDLTRLFQYLANWNVEIHYGLSAEHTHSITSVPAKAANCTEAGSAAYYKCTGCGKKFKDSDCLEEINEEDMIVPAKGHTAIIDEAVPATTTSTGLTEGSHCSVCNTVIVEQEIIPKLETKQYAINYNLTNGDTYLATLEINNPNPAFYTSEDGLKLKEISVPGYTFEGWYDGSSDKASRITNIAKGEKEEIDLYAHWTEKSYTIHFDCGDAPLVNVPDQNYTASNGATLTVPHLNGYTFMGWTDENGSIVKNIPKGTTGNKTLYANWTSKRNQTRPVEQLDEPIILEDTENGEILFTYEIGQVENVPLYQIGRYVNADGATTIVSQTKTSSISATDAKQIATTVSKATTTSESWSLSEDWNNVTSVSESYAEQNGITQEEAETRAHTSSDTYSVNSSRGGASTTTDSSGISAKTINSKNQGLSYEVDREQGVELGVEGKLTFGTEAGVGVPIEGIDINAGIKTGFELGGHADYTQKQTTKATGTAGKTKTNELSFDASHVSSNSSTWNTSTGYTSSNSTSQSQTVSKALSSLISQTKGYGESYSTGGARSSDQALSSTDTSSNEYASTLTYYTSEVTTTTTSTEISGGGYYRLVCAGTVHVFAVVGYDVATSTYYTYTYSVLDDNTYEWIDYSKSTPNFNDYENGVLPFEIPYEVYEYVTAKIIKSDGLTVDINTGFITGYNGNDAVVIIPSYISVDNHDGTHSSVKVKGFNADVFKGNTTVKAVILGDFITEIPAYAFSGCTSLKEVLCPGVTKIGANAFKGCINLCEFTVTDNITSVGSKAFENVPAVKFAAANKNVALAAVNSGATSVTLDISEITESLAGTTFTAGNAIQHFELQGKNKTYTDIKVKSDAAETVLNGLTITGCTRIPLEMSSDKIVLNRVNITCPGYAMLLSSDNAEISLYGTIGITSQGGNAIVCRDITLTQLSTNVAGKLNVSGNVYICGSINGTKYITVTNGSIITISEEEYARLIQGSFNVNFDANGGSVSPASKVAYCGTAIGTLPTPTRANYKFAGWFTAKTGGEAVDANTVFNTAADVTVYARWTANSYTASWSAGTGTTITVKRTSSPNAGAATGTLTSPATVYYGDVLSITYAAKTGYDLVTKGKTSITVTGNVTSSDIYATAKVKQFTASWSNGTGYTITVKRTSSSLAGASTGNLTSGATVYYNDVLSVTYTSSTGYSISGKGSTSITVTGNVNSNIIYATATPNNYTYTVKYISVNGTNLGSTTVTKAFGTTNTITPPAKSGYITPGSQSVKWDSTSKTITFKYSVDNSGIGGSSSRGFVDPSVGTWATTVISYSIIGRTANSVTIRATCTMVKNKNIYTPYEYSFSCAGQDKEIIPFGAWNNYNNATATQTVDFTISAGTGRGSTNVSWSVPCRNYYGTVLDNVVYTDTVVYPAY